MLAAYYGHADVVKFLIQNGGDPNRLNDKRQSPLAGAVFKKLDDVVEVSQQKPQGYPFPQSSRLDGQPRSSRFRGVFVAGLHCPRFSACADVVWAGSS